MDYEAKLDARCAALQTLCVREEGDRTGALETPIVLSSAFGFDDAEHAAAAFRGENDAFIYGRWGNPNTVALDRKLAALEGAEDACVTSSGMAAIAGAVLSNCENGAHIVAPRSMYAESARFFRERLPRFGIETTFVDGTNINAYRDAIRPSTRILYLETPSNPTLGVTDIAAVVALARERGIVTIADNTFATPFAQTPIALGVDLVVHSMTKALGGHGDAIAGVVCGGAAKIAQARDLIVKGFGGVLSPFNAFLVMRGLRTFALRQREACKTAARLARALMPFAHVHHPSLADHPQHAIATKQMHAFGSLLSFELPARGGKTALDRGRFVLENVRVATHAVSLGDVRTLIVHPASTTHSTMPAADRAIAGIADGLLRLSIGIESAHEIERDILSVIEMC